MHYKYKEPYFGSLKDMRSPKATLASECKRSSFECIVIRFDAFAWQTSVCQNEYGKNVRSCEMHMNCIHNLGKCYTFTFHMEI